MLNQRRKEDMWDYLKTHGVGCKVKTPYGIGVLVDVDAGAALYVEPLNKDEEWETYQFTIEDLNKPDI